MVTGVGSDHQVLGASCLTSAAAHGGGNIPDMLAEESPWTDRLSLVRVLILLEVTVGAVVTVGGVALVTLGLVTGRHDRKHGGGYIILGGLALMVVGLGILIPGLALRMRHPAKWVLQGIPLAGLIYWLTT
jgi:hypothetical protein